MEEKIYDQRKNLIYLAPIVFVLSIIPLIVYLKPVPLKGILFDSWTGENTNYDFFSYYKSMAILICSFIVFSLLIIRRMSEDFLLKKSSFYIPLAVYMICVIVSTVAADYKSVAVMGFMDRYEGALVLIAYLILLLASINFINSETEVRVVIGALVISAAFLSILGIFQYIGLDIFQWEPVTKLIIPHELQGIADKLRFNFGKNTIYSTMYNINYVGSYMAMLLPLSIVFYLSLKKTYKKIGLGLLSCLIYANLIGCQSRAGMVGAIIATAILLFILRKRLKENLLYIMVLAACFVLIFFGMNSASNGSLGKKVSTLNPDVEHSIRTLGQVDLEDIRLTGKSTTIVAGTETLKIAIEGNKLNYYDTVGNLLKTKQQTDGQYIFSDEKYLRYSFSFDSTNNMLNLMIGNATAIFYIDNTGIKIVGEQGRAYDKIDTAEKWGFEGMERLASNRGYIWSRSIPMIKQTLLYGKGPDTYAIYFPQQDYVGKLKAFDTTTMIVDKPHNMYLQIAFNTGVVSLIALLVLFSMYVFSSLALYFKSSIDNITSIVGVGILTAVCGYLAAAMFNDSVVSVAPVFWCLLGTGISCNHMVRNVSANIIKANYEKEERFQDESL